MANLLIEQHCFQRVQRRMHGLITLTKRHEYSVVTVDLVLCETFFNKKWLQMLVAPSVESNLNDIMADAKSLQKCSQKLIIYCLAWCSFQKALAMP